MKPAKDTLKGEETSVDAPLKSSKGNLFKA